MAKIFISYARADGTAAAVRLRAELEQAGQSPWRDIEDRQGGQEWRTQLRAALLNTDAVLVLLTPKAVQSPYVNLEWQIGLTLGKRVIPALILACDAPEELKALQRRDFSQPDKYTLAFAGLISDLSNLPTQSSAPTVGGNSPASKFNISGTVVQSNIGDYGVVNNSGNPVNLSTIQFLQQTFGNLEQRAQSLPADERAVVEPILQQAKAQAVAVESGDASEEKKSALQRLLTTLVVMRKDIGEVAIATLVAPPAGLALVVQKIAQKVNEQLKST